MGLLQPRSTSVPITTFTAIVVVLVLWILALLAIIMYLFLRWRKRAQRSQRTVSFNRSASFDYTAPQVSPSRSTALMSYPQRAETPSYPQRAETPSYPQRAATPSYPQRAQTPLYPQRAQTPSYPQRAETPSYPQRAYAPSYPPWGPSPLSETTSLPDLRPIRTAFDPVSPVNSTRIEDAGRIIKVSPTETSVSASPSSNHARLQVSHAGTPSQAAQFARLQPMPPPPPPPPPSDITDMSAETVDPGRQVVNPGYKAMLEQRGIRVSGHALMGSDDSTDAGAGTGLSYADRVRGMSSRGVGVDVERGRGRHAGHGRGGQFVTFGRDMADDGLGRQVVPLHVRKMASM